MACTRKRKRTIHLLSPESEITHETLPPLLLTHLPRPGRNTPTTQIMQRVWSKFDVIVIIKGMVNYIAEMGVDPMNNLDNFVEFINKNSSSSFHNGYDCSNITWNLGENGVDIEKNCTLHLESRNFDNLGKKNEKGCVVGDKDLNLGKNDCRKSLKKKGSVVDDVRVLNLEMNDGGSVKKKGSVVDNVSKSGKNDGGVSCLGSVDSGKKKGSSVVENVSNLGWNDARVNCLSSVKKKKKKKKNNNKKKGCVSENESNLRKKDGGISSSSTSNRVKKSNLCENKSKSRKTDGGVSCSSSRNSVKKSNRSEKKSNSGKKGNCKENVGRNKCVSNRKDMKKSKLGVDYGGVYCTKTRKDMKKRRYWIGVNRRTFGLRIRRTSKGLVVGKKSILKGKEDGGGNKQNNSNKNACRDHAVIQVKKGGVKNNNGGCANLSDFGCWDKNEVILREAVRRMISRRLSLRDELETDLLWCPPKIGVLKWNTDASVREDDNKAAIGGILRDWNGSFRCVFSCPLDCCGSNEAEVRAIYKTLEIASCKDWLLNLHMVIESDSMNAVRWSNEDNGGPLNLGYMLSFIRECRRWWPGLEIIYAGRKSNSVADRLSKQGHQRSADFVAWM